MALADRLGPPSARSEQTDAIAWVRSSIYSRFGRSMRYRSRFSVAIMYAAELAAGDVRPGRRAKLEEGRADCEAASVEELQLALGVLRAARKAAPTDLARQWADRAAAVLSEIGLSKLPRGGAAPPVDVAKSGVRAEIARRLQDRGVPDFDRVAGLLVGLGADDTSSDYNDGTELMLQSPPEERKTMRDATAEVAATSGNALAGTIAYNVRELDINKSAIERIQAAERRGGK